MIKNNAVLCTITLMHCLSICAMNKDFFTINNETKKPLEVEIHGRKKRFKTKLMQAKDVNPDSTVHDAKIVVFKHEGSEEIHYQIVTESPQVNPIEIDKNFIDSIITATCDQNTDHIVFGASNATDPRHQALCLLKITKDVCTTALDIQPALFTPKPKDAPKPVKKPKKVCVDDNPQLQPIAPQLPINPVDLPKDFKLPFRQASDFEEAGNNQYWHQDTLTKLYSLMQEKNAGEIKAHFDQTSGYFAHKIFEINKLSTKKLNEKELSEKEQAIKLLAQDMAYHYWSVIENNKDLNMPNFDEYIDRINSNIRILDHKSSKNVDGGDLSKTFTEMSCQSNLIIKEQREHDAVFTKATEKLKTKNDYQLQHAMLKSGLFLAGDVATGIAMSSIGSLAAEGMLSFVDNPELTKYENDLEKNIKEGTELLEKNSLANVRKKHSKEILEETQKNKQLFNIHNTETLDRKELAQKIKDLYEQQN